MTTVNLGLPFIAQGQAQKDVTHNEALTLLDAVVQLSVRSRVLLNPPATPAVGDRYIVPPGAGGVWAAHPGKIALWRDNLWHFFAPREGWIAFVEDEGTVAWVAGDWRGFVALSANGAGIGLDVIEEEVVCIGASVSTTIAIPNRAIVLAVSTRTTLAISGATSYSCGVTGNLSQFGSFLGIAAGATNIGVIGPTAFYASTPVVLTPAGGNFTAGRIRVAIQHLAFSAPVQ
jgi:hypothetical protein